MIDNGLYVDKPIKRHSNTTSFLVPTANAIQICAASAKRVRLRIRTDGSNLVAIGQQNPLDGSRTIRIAATYSEFILDLNRDGSIVQGNWFAQASVAAVNVGVIESVEE